MSDCPAQPSGDAEPARIARPAAEIEVLAHVENRGDVRVPDSAWAGQADSGLWIEGFALFPHGGIAAADLAYSAVLHDGTLSPWASPGEFCGTRGECRPIHGFLVRLRGAASERFTCACAARFIDGTELAPAADGAACIAPSLSPLEAMRIVLRPRNSGMDAPKPARTAEPTAIRPLRELTSDHVSVFPAETVDFSNPLVYSNAEETCSQQFQRHLLDAIAPTRIPLPEVFIGRYDSGTVVLGSDSFWVTTRKTLVAEQIIPYFAEHLLPLFERDPQAKLRHLKAAARETIEIGEECLLAARFGYGTWGHWINEILPKAVVAETVYPGRFRFVVPASVTQRGAERSFATAVVESLAAYGIAEDRLIRIEVEKNYSFCRLFDVGGCGMWNIAHPRVLSLMRDHLGKIHPERNCELLALTREDNPRNIHNETEVNALLRELGFRFIDPLREPFERQISHFKGANVIFSVYGSGLAGVIYAEEGIGVLACAPANWDDTYYIPVIQERRGLYADVRGPKCRDGVGFNAPFRIEPEHVAIALEKLLPEGARDVR